MGLPAHIEQPTLFAPLMGIRILAWLFLRRRTTRLSRPSFYCIATVFLAAHSHLIWVLSDLHLYDTHELVSLSILMDSGLDLVQLSGH